MGEDHAKVAATAGPAAKARVAKAAIALHAVKEATPGPMAKVKGEKAAMARPGAKADTTGHAAKEVFHAIGKIAVHPVHRMALQGLLPLQQADSSLASAKAGSSGRGLRKDQEDMAQGGAATEEEIAGAASEATAEAGTGAAISADPKAKAASAATSAPAS